MKSLNLKDFQKSSIIEKLYNPNLMKGNKSNHKYLRKEGNRYIYHESYQKGLGAKTYHHEILEDFHKRKAEEFQHTHLRNAIDNLREGKGNSDELNSIFEKTKYHALKASYHSSERRKGYNSINQSGNNNEMSVIKEIHKEHEQEGITPEKYAEAFEEYENNKNK